MFFLRGGEGRGTGEEVENILFIFLFFFLRLLLLIATDKNKMFFIYFLFDSPPYPSLIVLPIEKKKTQGRQTTASKQRLAAITNKKKGFSVLGAEL